MTAVHADVAETGVALFVNLFAAQVDETLVTEITLVLGTKI